MLLASRRPRPSLAALLLGGALAGCVLPEPLAGGMGDGEDARIPPPPPQVPGGATRFKSKIVPATAVVNAKVASVRYSPIIAFEVLGGSYHPRWPGATLAYTPGAHPLPQYQRELIRRAADRLNFNVGFKLFTVVADRSSADIPVRDSTAFPSSTVLGETSARVVTRTGPGTISIDFTETMALRPGLSNGLFYKVALHELGHAAGLEHNPEPNTLMNRGTGANTPDDFAPAERESLTLLYSLPDVPLTPPRETRSGVPSGMRQTAPPGIGWTLYWARHVCPRFD